MVDSSLLHPASERELLALVRRALEPSAEVVSSCLLRGGKFNTTYRVATASPARDLVIRLAPLRQDLLYRFERKLMRVEADLYPRLEARGVPVPKVVLHDPSKTVVGREVLITEFIPGLPLDQIALSVTERASMLSSFGGVCRRIHSLRGTGYGWLSSELESDLFPSWLEFLLDLLGEVAERSARFSVTPDAYIRRLEDAISRNRDLFLEPASPVLLHNDLHAGNLLLRSVSGGWELAALLDADRALYGDPDFEFATCEFVGPDFLRGYGRSLSSAPESVYRRKVYNLLKDMIDADACLVQLGNRRVYEILASSIAELAKSL
jgi:aminoglycoside phosphotransferase (APT) family kinase protein